MYKDNSQLIDCAVMVCLLTLEYIHCHHPPNMSCQCCQWEDQCMGECVCILYVIVCDKRQHSVVMCVGLIQFSAAACASAFDGCGHLWDLGSGKCIMLSLLSMSCCSYTVQFNPFITLCVLGHYVLYIDNSKRQIRDTYATAYPHTYNMYLF